MTSKHFAAVARTRQIAHHMSTFAIQDDVCRLPFLSLYMRAQILQAPIRFESHLTSRTYMLNRPAKLNALNFEMLDMLRPKVEEWAKSDLCRLVIGAGASGRFCGGGDVRAVLELSKTDSVAAADFFKKEFELDYILAAMNKPYVVVMDGITMGGGVGLSAPANFRVATENTWFAFPETNIGYAPDVGANYYMSRLDGELGTYLCLTGIHVKGRDIYEIGFATHFVSSRRIPLLLEALWSLESDSKNKINALLEDFVSERQDEDPAFPLQGDVRVALDSAFRHSNILDIFHDLEAFSSNDNPVVVKWAAETLETLKKRSPTSLAVALAAIRRGKDMTLRKVLEMELGISQAYCHHLSPDFDTGITTQLITKERDPAWSPATVEEVTDELVKKFVSSRPPSLDIPLELSARSLPDPYRYALPTEREISFFIKGTHDASGGTAVTAQETIDFFVSSKNGKIGAKEKVVDVIARKCRVSTDGWLEWIDSKA
ncbi:3-hydroxyisobutyryl-coenzyme A hydrolase isoform 1 [Fistulina hepatica ATCC 64428]|nr:3-hydroxyisobutyryl-coenzyme A hydrolase isoform 1 [Fistulina hepatica ATCC 64428]